jgi:predicted small lipoprotein YifL
VSLISRPRPALLVAAAVLALSGCGRRGDLEPPPNPAAVQTPAPAKTEMSLHKANPKIAPPKKDFVLDPLLQ